MDNEALLALYLEKLRLYASENLEKENTSVIEALKQALIFLEGEMQGY